MSLKAAYITKTGIFDWQTFIAEHKPSFRSPEQAVYLEALVGVEVELTSWAEQYDFPLKRVSGSAYTGIYSVPMPIPQLQPLLAAKYTLWLFVLDNFIDKLDYAQFSSEQFYAKIAYLDSQLGAIIRAFIQIGKLPVETAVEFELLTEVAIASTSENAKVAKLSVSLSEAWADIFADIKEIVAKLAESDEKYRRDSNFILNNFTLETARVVGAMRGELVQSFAFHRDNTTLPTLEQYLNRSLFSICLRAAGSVAVAFEPQPRLMWEAWIGAMEPGAKALRLSNDVANILKELKEGKVNSVTLVLANHGFAPMAKHYQETSPEIVQAQAVLKTRLKAELADFAIKAAKISLDEGPLAYYIYSSIAFTLAMYEKGDYAKLNTDA